MAVKKLLLHFMERATKTQNHPSTKGQGWGLTPKLFSKAHISSTVVQGWATCPSTLLFEQPMLIKGLLIPKVRDSREPQTCEAYPAFSLPSRSWRQDPTGGSVRGDSFLSGSCTTGIVFQPWASGYASPRQTLIPRASAQLGALRIRSCASKPLPVQLLGPWPCSLCSRTL